MMGVAVPVSFGGRAGHNSIKILKRALSPADTVTLILRVFTTIVACLDGAP
jgi:hypothetical protein